MTLIKDFSFHKLELSKSVYWVRKLFNESTRSKTVSMRQSVLQIRRLLIEIEYLWGQQLESLDPVALFCSAIASLFPINLFHYENKKILQEVTFRVKMSSNLFFQTSMFNIRSITTRFKKLNRCASILFSHCYIRWSLHTWYICTHVQCK